MTTFTFHTIAIDETGKWMFPDTINISKVYGIYLFAEGIAEFSGKVLPETQLYFLKNKFLPLPNDDSLVEYTYDNVTSGTRYVPFIEPHTIKDLIVSDPISIQVDDEIPYDKAVNEAWEEAIATAITEDIEPDFNRFS